METPRRVDGGALLETDEKVLWRTLADIPVTTHEPRCALRPLCRCHADCRGWGRRDG
jgi:hypothetical protein